MVQHPCSEVKETMLKIQTSSLSSYETLGKICSVSKPQFLLK